LILSLLVSAVLLNPTNAAADNVAVGQDATVVTCDSPMVKTLLGKPVRVPQRDLAVPTYVLGQLQVQYWAVSGCQRLIDRATYHSLLLEYLENRWMDDVIDGTPASAHTVWEAIYAAEQRATSVTDIAAHDRQLFFRRQLAYERTFEVEVPDPQSAVAAWSRQIHVRVANVSSWAMNWRTGIPELWFEPRSADTPVKFNCAFTSENAQSPSLVKAGQRIRQPRVPDSLGNSLLDKPITNSDRPTAVTLVSDRHVFGSDPPVLPDLVRPPHLRCCVMFTSVLTFWSVCSSWQG
jgi:hypothetical protein